MDIYSILNLEESQITAPKGVLPSILTVGSASTRSPVSGSQDGSKGVAACQSSRSDAAIPTNPRHASGSTRFSHSDARSREDSVKGTVLQLSLLQDTNKHNPRKRPAITGTPGAGSDAPKKRYCAWRSDEDALIVQLVEEGCTWVEISDRIPGRRAAACQRRYSDVLIWDEDLKNKFSRLYTALKKEVWNKIAKEMQMSPRAVEEMYWDLGRHEIAQRAKVPVFPARPIHKPSSNNASPLPTLPPMQAAARSLPSPIPSEPVHQRSLSQVSQPPLAQKQQRHRTPGASSLASSTRKLSHPVAVGTSHPLAQHGHNGLPLSHAQTLRQPAQYGPSQALYSTSTHLQQDRVRFSDLDSNAASESTPRYGHARNGSKWYQSCGDRAGIGMDIDRRDPLAAVSNAEFSHSNGSRNSTVIRQGEDTIHRIKMENIDAAGRTKQPIRAVKGHQATQTIRR